MCALGPISSLSIPFDDAYAHGVTDWAGGHAGYSDAFDGGLYTHADGDWTAAHAPYGEVAAPPDADVVECSSALDEDTDDGADETSWQAMWALTHPRLDQEALSSPDAAMALAQWGDGTMSAAVGGGERPQDELDDAFEEDPLGAASSSTSLDLSGTGTASFVLERGGAPPNHSVPMSTTSVIVSVPGTDIHEYVVFPDINPTLDITLPGLPPGEQDVVVEAFDGTRMVARGEFLVQVSPAPAAPASPPSTAVPTQKVAPSATPAQAAPAPPPPAAESLPASDPRDRWADPDAASELPDPPARVPLSVMTATSAVASEVRAHHATSVDAPSASAEAAASDTLAAAPTRASRTAREAVPSIDSPAPAASPRLSHEGGGAVGASWSPGQAMSAALATSSATGVVFGAVDAGMSGVYVTGVERGVPMIAAGAMEILAGFHRRDYQTVWRGALRSEAGGLLFAGSLVPSPLFVALGAVLARAYEAGA